MMRSVIQSSYGSFSFVSALWVSGFALRMDSSPHEDQRGFYVNLERAFKKGVDMRNVTRYNKGS